MYSPEAIKKRAPVVRSTSVRISAEVYEARLTVSDLVRPGVGHDGVPGDGEGKAEENPRSSGLGAVGVDSDDDGEDGCDSVGRDRVQLGLDSGVSKAVDDGRLEQTCFLE